MNISLYDNLVSDVTEGPDYARGEGLVSSSSDESSDEEEEQQTDGMLLFTLDFSI